jgi:hypothetical protein
MLHRNMRFLQSGEKVPKFLDNQIVQCKKERLPLEFGE